MGGCGPFHPQASEHEKDELDLRDQEKKARDSLAKTKLIVEEQVKKQGSLLTVLVEFHEACGKLEGELNNSPVRNSITKEEMPDLSLLKKQVIGIMRILANSPRNKSERGL